MVVFEIYQGFKGHVLNELRVSFNLQELFLNQPEEAVWSSSGKKDKIRGGNPWFSSILAKFLS